MSLERKTKNLVEEMGDNFDRFRLHPHYSLWGFAYHWSVDNFEESPVDDIFVDELFNWMKENNIKLEKPAAIVPRKRDPVGHNSTLSLYNQEKIEYAANVLLRKDVSDIVSGKHILSEVVASYVNLFSGDMKNAPDFVSYLVLYNSEEGRLTSEHEPDGDYLHAANRFLIRFRNYQVDKVLFDWEGSDLGEQARKIHHVAQYGRNAEVKPELVELYKRVKVNGVSEQAEEDAVPPPKIHIPGKKRVNLGNATVCIDWDDFFTKRHRDVKVSRHFSKEALMTESVRASIVADYMGAFEQDPISAMARLEADASAKTGIEQDIYSQVVKIYKGVLAIDDSDGVANSMHVPKRK